LSDNINNVIEIRVEGEIKLDQFLKWCRAASTGGQSKQMIHDHLVRVNGELEDRRSRKLKGGDLVVVENMGSFRVLTR